MSTYFVRTDGNNANAGTGYGTASAWQTIAKAVSMVADGDTVRIAPGTYRETVVIATSGPGSYINWKGDKEAQYFLDMKPGYVRITGCDTNEIVGSTTVIHINSKTHNRFYDLVVDGVAGLSAVNGSGGAVYFYRCIISGFGGLYGVSSGNTYAYNCVFTGTTGCLATTCYNCICMSGNTGFQSCICYNCMSVGTYTAFYLSTCYNCTAYSPGSAAFFACNSYNCLVYGGQIGFYNDGSYITYKGKALNCSYPAYGSSLTNLFNTSDIEVCQVSTATRLTYNIGLTQPTGTISGGHYEGYTDISKLFKIATALKFDISQKGRSTDTHSYRVSGMSNNVITPNVTGVTSNTNANDYYLEEGTYNGASFYVSRVRLHVIFLSTTLQAGRYVMTAGVTPNESAVGYCHSATLAGTYTNVSWTGVTIAVSQATNANQDYEIGGTYNGQNWYRSIFRNYVLFYSSTLQLNNWVLTAGIQVNEAATNYAYLNTITGTYTKVGTYTGTIINITFPLLSFTEDYDLLSHPRRLRDGILDHGCFEYDNIAMEWTTYYANAPAMKITRAGYKRLVITVKSGVPKTISAWVYFNLGGGSNKPQIIISSSEDILTTNPTTVTSTGSESSWQQLTSTFTPKADGMLFINFYSRETGVNAYAIFSDIQL